MMRAIRRNQCTTAVALAALALATAGVFAAPSHAAGHPAVPDPESKRNGSRGAIVGTWQVQVQSYVCGTNTLIGQPFASILSFHQGGTLTGTTTNPAFAQGQRGIDQGIWSYDDGVFKAKDIAFIFFTSPADPPLSPGFEAGAQTLSQTITLKDDSDQFTSEATTEFMDVEAKVYRTACATAVGRRFE